MENLGAMAYSRYTGFREITDRDVLELHCMHIQLWSKQQFFNGPEIRYCNYDNWILNWDCITSYNCWHNVVNNTAEL